MTASSPQGLRLLGPLRAAARGTFFRPRSGSMPTTRAAFLVDGFNLYHSLKRASLALGGTGTRWLDLSSFCRSFLSQIGGNAHLESVTYFSALAEHLESLKPDVTQRHKDYLECLRATGVDVHLAHFKKKSVVCPDCAKRITRHEEKETDVAMAITLIELLLEDRCDAVVLITGDSDLAPAIRSARRLFPQKMVCCCFPFDRVSEGLRVIATKHFKVRSDQYARHQLVDPFPVSSRRMVSKPPLW